MKLVVVTGLSGAGKSQALHTLEDIGFYCVDNLPPMLIPNMAKLCMEDDPAIQRVALGIDTRSGAFFGHADEALDALRDMNVNCDVLYLTASDEELIRRYKETRRAHPMGSEKMLIQNIKKEREMLRGMERRATRVIDTTTMLTRQLREMLLRMYGEGDTDKAISVNVLSFGFKHGIPIESDLVFDVRFMPNPYYVAELKNKTGLDREVRDFVFSFRQTHEFMAQLEKMITFLLPLYSEEGKTVLVIGIGCTGGHHRSVAVAHELAEYITQMGYQVTENHRDISR